MKHDEFILLIRKQYLKARLPIVRSPRIKRGTSHVISSITEDLFAAYIDQIVLGPEYQIWVDPQITINGLMNSSGKRPLLIRPDICIFHVKTRTIKAVFDIKMDLGYKRNEFIGQVKEAVRKLKKWRIRTGKSQTMLGDSALRFSKELKWIYIVMNSGNISEKQDALIKGYFDKNRENASLFVLTNKSHLNSYENNYEYELNSDDFKALDAYVASLTRK